MEPFLRWQVVEHNKWSQVAPGEVYTGPEEEFFQREGWKGLTSESLSPELFKRYVNVELMFSDESY